MQLHWIVDANIESVIDESVVFLKKAGCFELHDDLAETSVSVDIRNCCCDGLATGK